MKSFLRISFFLIFCLLITACSRGALPEIAWAQLIKEIYAPESIADISLPCTDIYTSYDRSGGNNDYNNGAVRTADGWLLLADLKGPGCLTRFWFTGVEQKSRFRFVFDDEVSPRLENTCRAFSEGNSGFPSGFVSTDQNCFYSGFPIPYKKRLRILVTDDGYSANKGKLFFQINAVKLKNKTVSSAQFPVAKEVSDVADSVCKDQQTARQPSGPVHQETFEIQPKSGRAVAAFDSGGIIRWVRIELDGWADMTFQRRMELLRQVWIRMSWDGSDKNSVSAPLGDFFGQMWEPKKINTLYFSVDEAGFECRFPMPFGKSAKISLENSGPALISGRITMVKDDGPVPDTYGYFHSGWQRSSENAKGYPHDVLKANGPGRLAGCLLGVASFDRSFWALESDETITRDREKKSFWQGTGLEDYFNGGWYYRTVFQNPLFGLTLKRPFRTVQYRFHLPDAVTFEKELKMVFERGPGSTSRAAYDSTVYYYLEHPAEAFGDRPRPSGLNPPPDEFEFRSLMTRLWDYEKADDFSNAEKLTQHALAQWNYPAEIKALLELRVLEYQTRRNGYDGIQKKLHAIREAGGPAGVEAAKLIEFHEKNAAVLFVYSNRKTTAFLDGTPVITANDPVRCAVAAIPVKPGTHVLSFETDARDWPDWVQVGLMKGSWRFGTDASWKCTLNPSGNWNDPAYDDASWTQSAGLCKGPPELEAVPFVYPDPYAGFQSVPDAIRASGVSLGRPGRLIFRKVFEIK